MSHGLLNVLQYYGAAAGAIAALVIALDIGRKATGWAFVLFVTAASALLVWGFVGDDNQGIGYQQIVLLATNLIGVYRYLIRKKPVHAG